MMDVKLNKTQQRKKNGQCSRCLRPHVLGKSMCEKHLIEYSLRASMRMKKRKNIGICTLCENKTENGSYLCEIHKLQKNTVNTEKRKNRTKRGSCIYCDNPSVYGLLCKSHHKQKIIIRQTTGRFSLVKANAKGKKLSFTIERDAYHDLISKPCFYCEMPNDTKVGIGLDRLNNDVGYELDNVVSCCKMCNIIRSNHLSVDEMKLIGQTVKNIKLNRVDLKG